MGHELSSSEVIEVLETTEAEMAESDTTVPETSAWQTNEPQTPELEASVETKQLNDSPPTI